MIRDIVLFLTTVPFTAQVAPEKPVAVFNPADATRFVCAGWIHGIPKVYIDHITDAHLEVLLEDFSKSQVSPLCREFITVIFGMVGAQSERLDRDITNQLINLVIASQKMTYEEYVLQRKAIEALGTKPHPTSRTVSVLRLVVSEYVTPRNRWTVTGTTVPWLARYERTYSAVQSLLQLRDTMHVDRLERKHPCDYVKKEEQQSLGCIIKAVKSSMETAYYSSNILYQ